MKQINYINCSNYIRLVGAKVISEKYLRVSEEDKDDPLDGEKEKEEEKIPKLVLLLTKGGEEFENFMIKSKDELISIVIQVAATMAMGEEMLELEHRDAHVSNILIEKTNEEDLEYYIGGKKIIVKSNKILIKMIDFGKSRIRNGTELVYCDDWDIESNEPNETEEHGDLHYKIYPRMNEIIGGNWKNYFPETNVLWIRYLIQILSRFDGSGLASEDPGTQAFQKAEESNKKQLAPEDGKEVAEKFFDAIKNCKTAGEFVFQLYEDSYFHYILKKV
uniref:non-specific serine/threonine protein kinase n=1 Tax=Panagrolaimus davidi TaxID=227884 RepID=A0A914PMW2_9BILA